MAISMGSAVGSGFTLIGRRPLSVIAWGFFIYFSILILFGLGFLIVGLPVLSQLLPLFQNPNPDPSQVGQAMLQVLAAIWPALLFVVIGGWIFGAMVQGAVYRAILNPDQRSWASLRLGRQEFALMLLTLLLIPVVLVVYLATIAIFVGVAFLGNRIGGAGEFILIALFSIAYFLALMWFALKFSLCGPMTFAEGRVRFFGSWSLTKGQGWSLFGLAWIMVLVILGVSIGYAIVSGIIGGLFTGGVLAATLASAGSQDPSTLFMTHWPMLLLAYAPSLVMQAIFQGISQAISLGPWADVYRQLRPSPDVAHTFT